jgi:hypothetical protein
MRVQFVLANPKSAFVHLDVSEIILGCMLGNLTWHVPLMDDSKPVKQTFGQGGKMFDSRKRTPQNTTISAVVILDQYPLRRNEMEIALYERDKTVSRKGDPVEDAVDAFRFLQTLPTKPETDVLRAIVFENPYARIPLNRDCFRGPFDVRWGTIKARKITRMNIGADLEEVEKRLSQIDRQSPISAIVNRSTSRRAKS